MTLVDRVLLFFTLGWIVADLRAIRRELGRRP